MRAVTHSFPVFTLGFRLGENRKPMGYMGAYTTLFHEVTYTNAMHLKSERVTFCYSAKLLPTFR